MRTLSLLFLLCLTVSLNATHFKADPNINKPLRPEAQIPISHKVAVAAPEKQILAQTSSNDVGSLSSTTIDIVAEAGNAATLNMGSGDNTVSIGVTATGDFEISQGGTAVLTIDSNGDTSIGSTSTSTKSLSYSGSFTAGGVPQWKLVKNENFWSEPSGWSNNEITTCGGAYLLGGYCVLSRGEEAKEFTGLPTHTTLRVTATFHYIDAWNGETAFLQLNSGTDGANEYVWTDRYDSTMAVNSINICGATYGEGRFAVPIDVFIPHTADSVKLTFGSTVDQDPCDQSWGISNVNILVM
jgi:hypothetical protein